jgi:hypothetical protein
MSISLAFLVCLQVESAPIVFIDRDVSSTNQLGNVRKLVGNQGLDRPAFNEEGDLVFKSRTGITVVCSRRLKEIQKIHLCAYALRELEKGVDEVRLNTLNLPDRFKSIVLEKVQKDHAEKLGGKGINIIVGPKMLLRISHQGKNLEVPNIIAPSELGIKNWKTYLAAAPATKYRKPSEIMKDDSVRSHMNLFFVDMPFVSNRLKLSSSLLSEAADLIEKEVEETQSRLKAHFGAKLGQGDQNLFSSMPLSSLQEKSPDTFSFISSMIDSLGPMFGIQGSSGKSQFFSKANFEGISFGFDVTIMANGQLQTFVI